MSSDGISLIQHEIDFLEDPIGPHLSHETLVAFFDDLASLVETVEVEGREIEANEWGDQVADEEERENVADDVIFVGAEEVESEEKKGKESAIEEKAEAILVHLNRYLPRQCVTAFPFRQLLYCQHEDTVDDLHQHCEQYGQQNISSFVVGLLALAQKQNHGK